ncbi:ABC-2 type transport system ATP-binding protein [Flavobacterium araucananum]|uniref:ABC transporter ATP-binding protein n=1 Tax=Flavobacterium araucananum TaxID=946678 RepID=A0A227NV14_9FLAO|nr:ABC transporter ATP-binding protein [Flavobacterium araucananum]OXG01557.1 ABC transporter ATP-binding protein [Flavobacterium araucananum]PWJ98943.1 ABC-2 type transport system ATP-binding protein [Flavobacterium araucananum]
MFKIDIKNKSYKNKTVLQNISISISKNGIYGVVGKNGEGKTTLFKCIMGLTAFDGSIAYATESSLHGKIAWCPTEPVIYDELTAKEFAIFYQELLNIESNNFQMFDVPQDKFIKEFSTGMKKKAYLNALLQKKYSIYVFDEPFNGLDLESNYLLMSYIRQLSKTSIVFISSHILESLYKDCDAIFVVKNTKIITFEKSQYPEIEEELFLK